MISTTTTAKCLRCDWTDWGKRPDLAAPKHTKATGHPTSVLTYPNPPAPHAPDSTRA